jgi:hypothetical protein
MSVFILNYIRWLEPNPPIRVRSQSKTFATGRGRLPGISRSGPIRPKAQRTSKRLRRLYATQCARLRHAWNHGWVDVKHPPASVVGDRVA